MTTGDTNRDAQSDMVDTKVEGVGKGFGEFNFNLKECEVCHEQFEEYWDEEEDVWRLRDCITSNGKVNYWENVLFPFDIAEFLH